jgi:hypothetical protein
MTLGWFYNEKDWFGGSAAKPILFIVPLLSAVIASAAKQSLTIPVKLV